MPPHKVLLLTYHFPPSGAVAVYRMLGLVRYLPKFDWQPVVVAPPSVPWEPEDESLLDQVPSETPVARVPFATGFFGKIWRYFWPESHWLGLAQPVCERMLAEHRVEAIITSSPPGCVHQLGLSLHEQYGLPWLADFRDPWVTNDSLATSAWLFLERWREARVMQSATVLIANTPRGQQGWEAAYPDEAHKMVTITNGFDPERFVASKDRRPKGEQLTMLHAGEFYGGRDPRPLLDALATMPGSDRPHVDFLGRRTEQLFDFVSEIRHRNLQDCVRLHDQVPYDEAIQRMMRADILLLVHTPEYRLGVPAKLYEYLGAGRPILALAEPDGDIAWVVRESAVLHRIVSPRDVPGIQTALTELIREIKNGAVVCPNPDALRQFTRERMAQRVAECLDRCVAKPTRTP